MKDSIFGISLAFLMFFSIFTVILISGCTSEKPEAVTRVKYVCCDGSIVSGSRDCPIHEAEKITITRYVCTNGDIVNDSEKCPVGGGASTLSATTTSTSTTMSLDTSASTVPSTTTTTSITMSTTTTTSTTKTVDHCRELGCPGGTKFVASSKSTKYHHCDCKWAGKINPDNLVCYDSVEDAQDDDKEPCGVCKPPD